MNLVITPTYNERKNISALIKSIFSLYPEIHLLVVDDNSPDGTADEVGRLQIEFPNLHLKKRSDKLGLASAYIEAIKESLGKYDDIQSIITMDADLSHDPAMLANMLRELEDCDLVLGSRYIKGGAVTDWELWRKILSKGGNAYARLITNSKIRDLTTGFCCFRADLLRKYDLNSIRGKGFAFLMEMKIVAENLGARIKELPIVFPGRVNGVSKLNNNIIYEGLVMPWKLRKSKYHKSSIVV